MKPKQIMVAIYNDTKTLEIVNSSPKFVLQLLAANQYRMVDLLGKKSGKNIDKISRLEKRELIAECIPVLIAFTKTVASFKYF